MWWKPLSHTVPSDFTFQHFPELFHCQSAQIELCVAGICLLTSWALLAPPPSTSDTQMLARTNAQWSKQDSKIQSAFMQRGLCSFPLRTPDPVWNWTFWTSSTLTCATRAEGVTMAWMHVPMQCLNFYLLINFQFRNRQNLKKKVWNCCDWWRFTGDCKWRLTVDSKEGFFLRGSINVLWFSDVTLTSSKGDEKTSIPLEDSSHSSLLLCPLLEPSVCHKEKSMS